MNASRLARGRRLGARVAVGLAAAMVWGGCDGQPSPPRRSAAQAAGAAPDHYLAGGSARAQPAALLPPAPRPTGPLPPQTACVSPRCHASYATAAHVHGPVAKLACDVCHSPDAGGHRYPLLRPKPDLCTFCHAVAGSAEHQHKALDQGCTACHDPHVSPAKFLLKGGSIQTLCASCHRVPFKRFMHSALARGSCTLCHQPHQSDNRMLLIGGAGPDHCYACHEDTHQALTRLPHVHTPAAAKCTTCHDPHSSDQPDQLRAAMLPTCLGECHEKTSRHLERAAFQHGAVSADRQCANCHDAHASEADELLHGRMDRVCLQCHDRPVKAADGRTIADMRPVLTESKYRHGPVRDGQCTACHDSHGADLPMLLRQAFPQTFYTSFDPGKYALCFGCHSSRMVLDERTADLTGFRNGELNLHYVHVHRELKGRTCKTCHAVHGSDLPKHMASEVPFEGGGWTMPILYEKTPDGGRCSPGCHEPLAYGRTQPAPGPTTRPAGDAPITRGAP